MVYTNGETDQPNNYVDRMALVVGSKIKAFADDIKRVVEKGGVLMTDKDMHMSEVKSSYDVNNFYGLDLGGAKMSDKVKLTRQQALIIEELQNSGADKSITVKFQVNGWSLKGFGVLNNLSTDEFIRALYMDDYEVKEQFKVGDFVKTNFGDVVKILEVDYNQRRLFLDGGYRYKEFDLFPKKYRIATEEETETEKCKRFFGNNNRRPWELSVGDVVEINDFIVSVDRINDGVFYFSNDIIESLSALKRLIDVGNVKVVCFAEDRKDITLNNKDKSEETE